MKKYFRRVILVGALATGLVVSNLAVAQAQVTVNASSPIATIHPAVLGTNVGCGDGEMVGPNVTSVLRTKLHDPIHPDPSGLREGDPMI